MKCPEGVEKGKWYRRDQHKRRYEKDWLAAMLNRAKQGAKKRGIEWSISKDDFPNGIPEECPLLGVKLTKIMGEGFQPLNPSIDRIDSDKGYIEGNVWIVSTLANSMKNNATKDQLIAFANGVLKNFC